MKKAEIKLTVTLDENNVPDDMMWESSDGENKEALPAKALFLALWDHHYTNSMRIDLWTKDMPIDDMKRFLYETLQTFGDTFMRAAGDEPVPKPVIGALREYCDHFAEKMEVPQKQG